MGDLTIVVAGCVGQQEGEALLRRVPEVDLVMGPQYANRYALVILPPEPRSGFATMQLSRASATGHPCELPVLA